MTREERKRYLRLIYARSFRLLGIGLSFASQNPGVMHACGHDVHTAVLHSPTFVPHEASMETALRLLTEGVLGLI